MTLNFKMCLLLLLHYFVKSMKKSYNFVLKLIANALKFYFIFVSLNKMLKTQTLYKYVYDSYIFNTILMCPTMYFKL